MSMNGVADAIKGELEVCRANLRDAQVEFDRYSERVTDLTVERDRLQAALDALEGKPPVIVMRPSEEQYLHVFPGSPLTYPKVTDLTAERPLSEKNTVTVNGEEVVLEPGFKVVKNSFGEESIVPEGFNPQPMEEPLPVTDFLGVGGIKFPAMNEEFDDPLSQL